MMELNVILNLLVITVGVVMTVSRVKLLLEHKNALKEHNQNKDFKKIFTGMPFVLVYLFLGLLAGGVSGYLFLNPGQFVGGNIDSQNYALVFAILSLLSILEIIKISINHTTYYNEQGIFHNTTYFRYNSIKGMKLKSPGISTEVSLFSEESVLIPTKALRHLERYIIRSNRSKKD